jgi:hypothetical protein
MRLFSLTICALLANFGLSFLINGGMVRLEKKTINGRMERRNKIRGDVGEVGRWSVGDFGEVSGGFSGIGGRRRYTSLYSEGNEGVRDGGEGGGGGDETTVSVSRKKMAGEDLGQDFDDFDGTSDAPPDSPQYSPKVVKYKTEWKGFTDREITGNRCVTSEASHGRDHACVEVEVA